MGSPQDPGGLGPGSSSRKRSLRLRFVSRVLRLCADEFSSDLTLTQLLVALEVAASVAEGQNPDINTVAKRVGASPAAMSRTVAVLGNDARRRRKPYGVITRLTDPMDIRRKPLDLTEKGRKVARGISDLIGREVTKMARRDDL